MKGSQSKKIKEVLYRGHYNAIDDEAQSRMSNAIVGAIGGFLLGALFKQNTVFTGIIGGIIGYVIQKR